MDNPSRMIYYSFRSGEEISSSLPDYIFFRWNSIPKNSSIPSLLRIKRGWRSSIWSWRKILHSLSRNWENSIIENSGRISLHLISEDYIMGCISLDPSDMKESSILRSWWSARTFRSDEYNREGKNPLPFGPIGYNGSGIWLCPSCDDIMIVL